MRALQILFKSQLYGLFLLLAACGGSSGGGPAPIPPVNNPAPSGLSYATPPAYTVGQTITNLTATVTGSGLSYSISPALPAGMAIDAPSGAIYGTPTVLTPKTNYTVTATNTSGSTTAVVSITVNDVKPGLSYANSNIALAAGVAVDVPIVPTTTGGAVTSWSIAPPLPVGLVFSASDGSITGTPASNTASTTYTVTAMNSGGQSTFALGITVEGKVVLDLGHNDPVNLIRFSGSRVLSQDSRGHWVLWDYASATNLASGNAKCTQDTLTGFCVSASDLAGTTIAVATPGGFELRSATDGHLLTTITTSATSWWKLASDGSYLSAGSATGLSAWSTTGAVIASRAGDYSKANTFAAPDQIRVIGGAAGANVVETFTISSAAEAVSPAFQGSFANWFVDGGSFLTAVNSTLLVYSKVAVQQEALTLTNGGTVGGSGNWFWNYAGSTLAVYTLGGSTTPAASFALTSFAKIVPTANTIGVLQSGNGAASVINLSGATPTKADYVLPVQYDIAYGAGSASQWLVGTSFGVVLDGANLPTTPRYFGYGEASSIAGGAGEFVVATASGQILHFDAASLSLAGTIPMLSSKVELSTDGTVLAALASSVPAQFAPDRSLKIYSLPSQTLVATWPYTISSTQYPSDLELSGSGTVLAQTLVGSSPFTRQATGVAPGGPILWTDTYTPPPPQVFGGTDPTLNLLRLSADGTLISALTGVPNLGGGFNIVHNGVLVTAVAGGTPVGWLDNNRVIANTYTQLNPPSGIAVFTGALIYDATGHQVGATAIPRLHQFQVLGSDSIYGPEVNQILSVSTGTPSWSSGNSTRGIGAVAGSQVVFVSGSLLLASPR